MDTVNTPDPYLADLARVGYSDLILLSPGRHKSG